MAKQQRTHRPALVVWKGQGNNGIIDSLDQAVAMPVGHTTRLQQRCAHTRMHGAATYGCGELL